MRKVSLLMSVACAALAAPVAAQNTTPPSTTEPTASSAAQGDVSAETQNAGEIVVTATRRAEALSDVPIAVSAVSAETLQNSGANDIRQLNQVAPSLLVSSTGTEANGSARIRGVGTVGDNPGLESSVAVFIDGVYRSRSGIGLNELGEIERVEVLRGPQGTLFGRNASAGLIHIISKAPSFDGFAAGGEVTYGNYDNLRLAGGINIPLGETLAGRIDAVYNRRDGFYFDPTNNTDVNNRNRYFVRGQLLFEPTDALKVRIIGDYTRRNEKCCGAVYVSRDTNGFIGNLNEPATPLSVGGLPPSTGNNIINVLRDLGQPLSRFQDPYSRIISVSPGRSYQGITEDKGISGEVNFDFGGATLTSITAYRDYHSDQGADTDYSTVDILYRAPGREGAFREFKTFSQELRLQGSLFEDRLDWLVGAYFADEDLTVGDNLRFGRNYGRFATCRLISGGGLAGFYSPTNTGCLSPTGAAVLSGALAGAGINSPFGPAGPTIVAAINRLDTLNDLGSTTDRYFQNSRNYAFFTHNIFKLTDTLSITAGVRYTNERKRFNATFGNDNTVCTANQAALLPLLANAGLAPVAGGIIGLSCQGNSTAELNGVSIRDQRNEDEFTGTGIISFKPNNDFLFYGSYARGYKAGGFNLDRSALKSPITPFGGQAGTQALVGNLQFAPETVNAFELGMKYSSRRFSVNVAAFRQQFSNFQLNTFNGTVFLVQNINGCSNSLGGADRDQNIFPTGANFNPAAVTSGSCAADDVTYGVRAQGVEIESSLRPSRDVSVALGLTYTDTSYRENLVGSTSGAPLDVALRRLPGQRLSNAPEFVATGSFTFTPPIGDTGLSGLLYVDGRLTSDFNTGSDLFPQKIQDGFALVNARIGIRGPEDRWALEGFVQNAFNKGYAQVAFNSPFQAGANGSGFTDPQFPGGRQLFSQFLAEPRTYGLTARVKF